MTLCCAALFCGCRSKSDDGRPDTADSKPANVLFVSFDTTRADHIGCYGHAEAMTPHLDALAVRGVRFERAYSQVPLTLPSHSTMMTGKYPREFGVRDNGRGAVGPEQTTLAEIARDAGLRTGAFIAAFVLESRYGLAQGFDTYDDDLDITSTEVKMLDMERSGDVVADRAIRWLEADISKPFFCWVHFYDPHHPYHSPEPFVSKCRDPYDAEIAFADAQLGRILDSLRKSGRLDRTLVVVVGDHGESFGEHQEAGHSIFLYDTNLHVPMLAAGPGVKRGFTAKSPVEVVDLFRTVCDLMKWPSPEGLLSESLAPALAGHEMDPDLCYAESHYVFNAYRWAEQRSVTSDRWKYISSTRSELFDLQSDPGEKRNVIAEHPEESRRLSDFLTRRYGEMVPGQSAAVEADAKARQAIESLGYVGGSRDQDSGVLTPNLPDPKDLYDVINKLAEANRLVPLGKCIEARDLLLEPVKQCPDSVRILTVLASAYVGLKEPEKAIPLVKHALEVEPQYPDAVEIMGDALYNMGQYEQAAQHYIAETGIVPGDAKALYKLGHCYRQLNRMDEAVAAWRASLEAFPGHEQSAAELMKALSATGHAEQALAFMDQLTKLHPRDTTAKLNYGMFLLSMNRVEPAEAVLREVIQMNPGLGAAYNKLGICLAKTGRTADAVEQFQKALGADASRAEAFFNLGVVAEKSGKLQDAVGFFEGAMASDPTDPQFVVCAVRVFMQMGRNADVVRVLKTGTVRCPTDLRILNTLADILATSADDSIRDGKTAVELAQRGCQLTNDRHPGLLATLAAAYAESGQFDQAIETMTHSVELARAGGRADQIAEYEAQLQLYREHKPLRR